MKRLALGTVQFGSHYGVANRIGQISQVEIRRILRFAKKVGLDTLDTAVAYGQSEKNLGRVGVESWRVISKLPALPTDSLKVDMWVEAMVSASLARLKLKRLDGLLLHRSTDLIGPAGSQLIKSLQSHKDRGLISKIGVSVYELDQVNEICALYPIDIIQVPFNPIDRRLTDSGWLERFTQSGTEVHVRSVFLQGLLLMPPRIRPIYFNRWQSLWECWDAWLAEKKISPLAACLHLALNEPKIDRIVVGVDSLRQFREIIAALNSVVPSLPEDIRSDDPDLINPSHWKLT